jgi:hypothetical protein
MKTRVKEMQGTLREGKTLETLIPFNLRTNTRGTHLI